MCRCLKKWKVPPVEVEQVELGSLRLERTNLYYPVITRNWLRDTKSTNAKGMILF